jgi:transposase InsO family protein
MRRRLCRRAYGSGGVWSRCVWPCHAYDNAGIASWHRVLQKAWVYQEHFRTRAHVALAIFADIEGVDNRHRLPSALGCRTPLAAADALSA